MNVLGIDIGGTFIKYGVFSPGLELLHEDKIRIARNLPDFFAQILEMIGRAIRSHGVEAVGIGVPGFISKKEKRIELSPNITFLNSVRLEREVSDRVGLPVTVDNDANVAALGEFISLEEPRPDSFVHLTLGTGIGSGIIIDGRIFRGECGFAAELGHVTVHPEGRSCGCGSLGCAETESSETGIIKSFQEISKKSVPITALEIFRLLQDGDETACRSFDRAGYYLGILFNDIANFLNPGIISIGGGVAAAGEAILGPAKVEFEKRIVPATFACTRIETARQQNRAGIVGAAHLARILV